MVKDQGILGKLASFSSGLKQYEAYRIIYANKGLKQQEYREMMSLRERLNREVGRFGSLITKLTGKEKIHIVGKGPEYDYDMWAAALRIEFNKVSLNALRICIDYTVRAIGKLEDDIKKGKRDPNTGERIEVISTKLDTSIRPKAFIAHEGETRALTMLKEFLEAFGIHYFIAESKASDGRSIERQVDWTQSEADFAICLATKGKAINKKTGKHYMAPNIIDELGRARQVFGNKIILLVQKGVEVHTNIREIVYETFTTTNMERAFIKIVKELTNWGFITVGITKEHPH